MSSAEHVVAVFDWRFLKQMTARATPESRADAERAQAHDEDHGASHGVQNRH